MAASKESGWTGIYETRSATDAELVRTTLEVAGYRVSIAVSAAVASKTSFKRRVTGDLQDWESARISSIGRWIVSSVGRAASASNE